MKTTTRVSFVRTIIATVLFFVSIQSTYAISFVMTTMGGYNCGACEMAHTATFAVSPDRSSYSPGDTMVFSGQITTGISELSVGVVDDNDTFAVTAAYGSSFDTGSPAGYTPIAGGESVPPTTFFVSGSTVIPSLSAGTHTLSIRGTARTRFVPQGYNPQITAYRAISFDIAAAPQPTVNLFFSQALEKLKKLFV